MKNKEVAKQGEATYTVTIKGELPDLNQIIASSKEHFGKYAEMKKANTELVAWKVKRLPRMDKIDLTCTWFCKNKRKDKDNIAGGIKFILDGLVQAGVIENDGWKQIGDFTHKFAVDKHNPRIELTIRAVHKTA